MKKAKLSKDVEMIVTWHQRAQNYSSASHRTIGHPLVVPAPATLSNPQAVGRVEAARDRVETVYLGILYMAKQLGYTNNRPLSRAKIFGSIAEHNDIIEKALQVHAEDLKNAGIRIVS